MRKLLIIALISLFTLGFAQDGDLDLTIVQGLAESGEYTTLVSLLAASGLDQELEAGTYTLFAPRDSAFEDLADEASAQLEAEPELLRYILLNHVVEGAYGVNDLQDADAGSIVSLAGEPLEIELGVGGLAVNESPLDSTDVEFTYANGIVHGVGDMVIPASLYGSYEDTGLFDGSILADQPVDVEETAEVADTEMVEDDLATVIANDGRFTTLLSAVQAAGLESALTGEQAYTVFAPTDEAFAALPEGDLDALLADTDTLARLLNYHIVDGTVMSTDLTTGAVPSLEGSELAVDTTSGVLVDSATVVEADIDASNGVVHAIDSVLIPADLQ